MAVAGYAASVRKSGAATAVANEPTTSLSSTKYQITATAKRCIDFNSTASLHFKDNATTIPFTQIASIDFVFGEVTFNTAMSASVTFSGAFLPLTTSSELFTEAKGFKLSEKVALMDTTVFTDSTPFRKKIAGLRDVEASVDVLVNNTDYLSLATLMTGASVFVLELQSAGTPRFRGFAIADGLDRNGQVDGLIEATLSVKLATQIVALGGATPVFMFAGYSVRSLTSS